MLDASKLAELGVVQQPDGGYARHRTRTTNHQFDPADPKAELKGMLVSYDVEDVPWPVVLPLATDPESVEEARKKAVKLRADFWHPKHGWLRWGRKREQEAPENLGAGAVRYARRTVTVPAPADPPDRARQKGQ